MRWSIALVLDQETTSRKLGLLLQNMPVWAVNTPERVASTDTIRSLGSQQWEPDPAFTLFEPAYPKDPIGTCGEIVPTIREHHPALACILLVGVPDSAALRQILSNMGFDPEPVATKDGFLFRLPLDEVSNVRQLHLDAQDWKSTSDIYESFFQAVGSPRWHGKNFDAMRDSIAGGFINEIEVPYRLIISNSHRANPEVKQFLRDLSALIRGLSLREGCPVAMELRHPL